jgi:hypothetical protein
MEMATTHAADLRRSAETYNTRRAAIRLLTRAAG